jgi:hypothetical protein
VNSELEYLTANATPVQNAGAVDGLPLDTVAVLVALLDDSVAEALLRLPRLRALVHRGNSSITDAGLQHLETLSTTLEALDLEWSSAITGRGLRSVAKLRNLRWLDLSFCPAITREEVRDLQRALPDCEVEFGEPSTIGKPVD